VKFPDYGAEYRAKKAKGDIKLKGKSDPYAYVPLDFGKLNKRKKAKLTGQFSGIMSAARKGVQRGHRNRTKSFSHHKHLRKSEK
jgi:ribosomal RNA-processing protein 12